MACVVEDGAELTCTVVVLPGAGECGIRATLGVGAVLRLWGVGAVEGDEKSHITILVEHVGRESVSEVVWRLVAEGRGSIVCRVDTVIEADAKGSSARQEVKGRVLSYDAVITVDPRLSLLTSDIVAASHGASVGNFPDEEMAYLAARGVTPEGARRVLTWGFVGEVVG